MADVGPELGVAERIVLHIEERTETIASRASGKIAVSLLFDVTGIDDFHLHRTDNRRMLVALFDLTKPPQVTEVWDEEINGERPKGVENFIVLPCVVPPMAIHDTKLHTPPQNILIRPDKLSSEPLRRVVVGDRETVDHLHHLGAPGSTTAYDTMRQDAIFAGYTPV